MMNIAMEVIGIRVQEFYAINTRNVFSLFLLPHYLFLFSFPFLFFCLTLPLNLRSKVSLLHTLQFPCNFFPTT